MNAVPTMGNSSTLVDVIDRILDKGVVINADISVSLVGIELLGIRIRAAVASFETAAKWGLEFPGGTNLQASGWKKIAAAPVEATAGIGLEGEKPWP